MTVRSTTQIHFGTGDVSHRHARSYSTLEFASSGSEFYVHFSHALQVDEVIAELVALRAEMTAEPEPLVVSESTLSQVRLVAEDIEAGTWPPAVAS